MKVYEQYVESPVGLLRLVAHERALTGMFFAPSLKNASSGGVSEILNLTTAQLAEYFAGKRRKFELPLEFEGTDFQKRVWSALLQIPYGQTRSYGEIAREIGSPKAVRAVGLANSKNPISIIAACHRVIGANGKLTGYAGGLPHKEFLLKLEKNAPMG